jgi:thiol-disulfide isomerase/thioredoxin
MWIGRLEISPLKSLPFKIALTKGAEQPVLQIKNGKEQIDLLFKEKSSDTLIYAFPEFDSDLYIVFQSTKKFKGYWFNKDRKGKYTMPLSGHFCENNLFDCRTNKKTTSMTLTKKWRVQFASGTDDMFPALGLFDHKGTSLAGTFLTETGDFRFLDGNFCNDKLYLSCFDGSHAFLFTANLINDTLKGVFYSGTHYVVNWIAVADDDYELTDPNKLTYVINDKKLEFYFNDIQGKSFQYPNEKFKNKVTIIQIMGSWCPNCMDETRYFMDLYQKYNDQGLEIILIGYESGKNEQEYTQKLKKLQDRFSIPFTMLVGGPANKNKASKDFAMLNEISSFPTSLFIDRQGNISKVHTGFNGPGTGEYYTEYMIETETFLKGLLKN